MMCSQFYQKDLPFFTPSNNKKIYVVQFDLQKILLEVLT